MVAWAEPPKSEFVPDLETITISKREAAARILGPKAVKPYISVLEGGIGAIPKLPEPREISDFTK